MCNCIRANTNLAFSSGSLEIIPENCPLDPVGRLSISLDTDNCLLELEPGPGSPHTIGLRSSTLDPRRQARHTHAESKSFKSSVCLPQVGFLYLKFLF